MLENWILRPFLTAFLKIFFRVEVRGLEHYHAAGDKVIILPNHVSFLDPFLIAVLMPEKPAFAMNVFQADKWYFRWIDHIVKLYKLDPTKPMTMKALITDMKERGKVVIFPEGRISTTGGIMKTYDGARLLIDKTDAVVLPVHIDGAEYSTLSKVGKLLRQRMFPKLRVTILPPKKVTKDESLYDILTNAAFEASDYKRPVLDAICEAYEFNGGKHEIATDLTRADMTYRQLFIKGFVLSGKLSARLKDQQNVGFLLPNALGGMVTFVSLHMLGKTPCMLNFSSGEANILHACNIACVKMILTSRAFIEKGQLEHIAEALENKYTVIYLEDLRPEIGVFDKLCGLYKGFSPRRHLRHVLKNTNPQEPAVILYTSGSEGAPKGVALSHINLLSNLEQACSRLDLMPVDRLFNAMPIFHSFGLTVGMILPLLRGIKVFLYPSPLHYRIIPELIYDTDATIMLGTDTFFNGYARYAHDYDFHSVRLAVAGAEKLKDETRKLWVDRFNVNIMQGYGVTETSPVVSFNTYIEHKHGTVGRPFPGMECKLEPVEGIEQGGRLFIKGPNVMLGYLKADQPGVIQPQGEWYDTGDIVDIDEDGYITILGRAKRFAKIGGEMVSLLAVEELALRACADVAHAAIAISDPRKGEQIILYSESSEFTRDELVAQARKEGVAEISLPRKIIHIEEIPRLGNGKINYPALQKLAADQQA